MNPFVYEIPTKVYFGKDQLHHLGQVLKNFGTKVLLVYGGGSIKRNGVYDTVISQIEQVGMEVFELSGVEPNPRVDTVRRGVKLCKDNNIDVVLAVGGGSTIDAVKFIAAGACTEADPWEFFTTGAAINSALPIVTILTLAATGSEMDSCGVISNEETNDKLARYSDHLFPKVSFLDPTITYSVNKFQTACGAADMLSHIIEVYFTIEKDLYMLDAVMEGLMKTVIKYGAVAVNEPTNYEARANLMWTGSWAINGFVAGSKTTAWSCHPMEHVLSAYYDITHGLGLAILTPKWMQYCLDETTVDKFYQFGTNVFGINSELPKMEVAKQSIECVKKFLYEDLGLQSTLTEVGIGTEHFDIMAEKACRGRVLPSFKPLGKDDIKSIFEMCL